MCSTIAIGTATGNAIAIISTMLEIVASWYCVYCDDEAT
jgi:hypothetical protein